MRFAARFLLSAVCLLLHGQARSGEFLKAYEAALQNDTAFQAARAELASARQSLPMARAALWPSVSLSVSDNKVNGTRTADNALGVPISSPLDYRSPAQSLSIRAPIFNREASQKVNVAQAQVSYAEAVFATRQAELVDRLTAAYLQRLLNEQSVASARAQVDAMQAQRDQARRRSQLGEGTRPELLDAEASLDIARVQLIDAQDQLSVAALSLQHIVGVAQPMAGPEGSNAPTQSPAIFVIAPSESLATLLSKAEANSPSIAARRHAVTLAQAAVARNRSGHYPRLDFVASATSSSNESLSTLNQTSSQSSVGLQLNLPIYSGGYVNASVTQALADQDKAEAELASELQAVARDLTKFYLAVVNGPAKVQAYQKAVASGSLALEGARKGVATGFSVQADIAASLHKLAQARRDLAQSTFEVLIAQERLLAKAGGDAMEAVVQIDAMLNNR